MAVQVAEELTAPASAPAPVAAPRVIPPRRVQPSSKGGYKGGKFIKPTVSGKLIRGVGVAAAVPTVRSMCAAHVHQEWRWSDVAIHRAIRKFFPEPVLRDFPLPPLEDLVNDDRLAAWRVWAEQEGVTQAPIQAQGRATGWEALSVGKQRGATGSKHAVDAVVGFGMGHDQHFQAACTVSIMELDPFALDAKTSPDLRFAAEQVARTFQRPRETRQELRGLVKELAGRTKPLSDRLGTWQPWHVQRVAGKIRLGFIVVVCLLILWGDGKMPGRFVTGFQGGGVLEESRLWELIDEPAPIPEAEVFEQYQHNRDELVRRPLDKEATFLWQSCEKECTKQVSLKAVPESALIAKYGKRGYSAIPCFTHVQACGKKRRIDNAKKSRDNEATQYTERFRLLQRLRTWLFSKAALPGRPSAWPVGSPGLGSLRPRIRGRGFTRRLSVNPVDVCVSQAQHRHAQVP